MDALLEIKKQVREGRLLDALAVAKSAVRSAPSDASARATLFALFAANGETERANDQLDHCCRLGANAALAVYPMLLRAEAERNDVWLGRVTARTCAETPPAWLPSWQAALQALAGGDTGPLEDVAAARQAELDEIEGSNAEFEFTGFRNCDTRLSGFFEGVFGGHYQWLPFEEVAEVAVAERPEMIQDLIWMPTMVTLKLGTELRGYLYTTYPGTASTGGEAERLACSTAWDEGRETVDLATGLQLFALGSEIVPLVSLGRCEFGPAAADGPADEEPTEEPAPEPPSEP